MTNLITITKELSNYLDTLKRMFEQSEKPKADKGIYFSLLKKRQFLTLIYLFEKWEFQALQAIRERKSTLHSQQITSTEGKIWKH